MNELDLTSIESEICRLPAVQVARIVDDGERITEVHIVATPTKSPKNVVRDVQSIALATFGLEIDHRIVSVVQLGHNGDGGTRDPAFGEGSGPRTGLVSVSVEIDGLRATAAVVLSGHGGQVTGRARATMASAARHRLVARATVDALAKLEPAAESVDVDHAQIVRIGSEDVAVVTMLFVAPPAEYSVSGSAIVRSGNEGDAVARAVLDATNRRLVRVQAQ